MVHPSNPPSWTVALRASLEESRLIRKFHWPTGLLPNDQISICVKVPQSIQVLGGLVDSIPVDLPESGECFRTQSLSIMMITAKQVSIILSCESSGARRGKPHRRCDSTF